MSREMYLLPCFDFQKMCQTVGFSSEALFLERRVKHSYLPNSGIWLQVVFYKKLHSVYFVDAIPKSPSGKILRKDLRNKL